MVSTHLKNISPIGSFPHVGVKTKHIWNHHLEKELKTKLPENTTVSPSKKKINQSQAQGCKFGMIWPWIEATPWFNISRSGGLCHLWRIGSENVSRTQICNLESRTGFSARNYGQIRWRWLENEMNLHGPRSKVAKDSPMLGRPPVKTTAKVNDGNLEIRI